MRRLFLILLGLAVYSCIWVFVLNAQPEAVAYETIEAIAAPGDTAWTMVKRANKNHDPRELVYLFDQLNGSTDLKVGQRVLVPIFP